MKQAASVGLFGDSIAALGGGGIGNIWGPTDEDEALATVRAALDGGISFFDMAPLYGNAEEVLGRAFDGRYPKHVRVSTKCMVGNAQSDEVRPKLSASLDASCSRLRRPFIDLFILHGYIVEDAWRGGPRADLLDKITMPWTLYTETIVPTLEGLVAEGRIGAWGITTSPIGPACAALSAEVKPSSIQAIANVLNSSGSMNVTGDPQEDPAALIPVAVENGVRVMGIRALAAGSLTDALDRPVKADSHEALNFERAKGFRALARQWGVPTDQLAYRFALSLSSIDNIVLGAKSRSELTSFFEAEAAPRLSADEMTTVRASII